MSATAKLHYDRLLADVYEWSARAAGDPFERARALLDEAGLLGARTCLDLGAGFGPHVVPLVREGAHVTAVDFSATLLARLRDHTAAYASRVEAFEADFVEWLEASHGAWDAILCMGDTLTHLDRQEDVSRLFAAAARRLRPDGKLLLSYRDSTGYAAVGAARFVPVARDARRTMCCFLEAIDAEHLRVTDIVTETADDGLVTRIGDYIKLRLAPSRVEEDARTYGLSLERSFPSGGLVVQVFLRRARSAVNAPA